MLIETEVTIDAPPSKLWSILTEFDAFPEWNPFLTRIKLTSGDIQTLDASQDDNPQAALEVSLEPEGPSSRRIFTPAVVKWKKDTEFAWLGSVRLLGLSLFTGEHHFELRQQGDGKTLFRHYESFGGLLCRPILYWIGDKTRRGFENMNQALKQRAESVVVV